MNTRCDACDLEEYYCSRCHRQSIQRKGHANTCSDAMPRMTRALKNALSTYGLNPREWIVSSDSGKYFQIVNKNDGRKKTIMK